MLLFNVLNDTTFVLAFACEVLSMCALWVANCFKKSAVANKKKLVLLKSRLSGLVNNCFFCPFTMIYFSFFIMLPPFYTCQVHLILGIYSLLQSPPSYLLSSIMQLQHLCKGCTRHTRLGTGDGRSVSKSGVQCIVGRSFYCTFNLISFKISGISVHSETQIVFTPNEAVSLSSKRSIILIKNLTVSSKLSSAKTF